MIDFIAEADAAGAENELVVEDEAAAAGDELVVSDEAAVAGDELVVSDEAAVAGDEFLVENEEVAAKSIGTGFGFAVSSFLALDSSTQPNLFSLFWTPPFERFLPLNERSASRLLQHWSTCHSASAGMARGKMMLIGND